MMLVIKNPPANAGHTREACSISGSGRSPGGSQATHSSVLTWRIPRSEEPGGATVPGVAKSRTWPWSHLAHKVAYWQLYEQPQLMESVWKAALPTLSAVLCALRERPCDSGWRLERQALLQQAVWGWAVPRSKPWRRKCSSSFHVRLREIQKGLMEIQTHFAEVN